MANTKYSLFPFSTISKKDFTVDPVCIEFAAPLVAGKYVFSSATTPAKRFGELLQGEHGFVAGVMISANTTADNFAAAIDKPLELQILHGANQSAINMCAFPFSTFAHGDNFLADWEITAATVNRKDDFLLQVTGEVNQLTGMTQNELILRVAFNYIRAQKNAVK